MLNSALLKLSGLIFFGLFTQYAFSQSSLKLTLEQAVAEGLRNSHIVQASQSRVDAAFASASISSANLLPTVTGGGSYTRLSDVPGFEIALPTGDAISINNPILNSYSLRVGVEQPLFTGGRLIGSVKAQQKLTQAAKADLETDQRELIYRIHQAYWQLYKAREFRTVVDENVLTIESHLKDVNNLLEQGIVTKTEVLAVEVQLSSARLRQIDARDNVHISSLALCNLTGLPLETTIEIASTPTATPHSAQPMNGASLTQTALNNRSELRSLSSRIESGNESVRAARGGWLPQIKAFGNLYYSRPNPRIFPAHDEFDDTWDLGVGASWTLWNWGATANHVKQSRAQVQQIENMLDDLKGKVAVEVATDVLKLNEAHERIEVASAGARLAEESLRSVREKFKNGLAPNSDLLDAEDNLLVARWSHTQALVDYELAAAKLEKTTAAKPVSFIPSTPN